MNGNSGPLMAVAVEAGVVAVEAGVVAVEYLQVDTNNCKKEFEITNVASIIVVNKYFILYSLLLLFIKYL